MSKQTRYVTTPIYYVNDRPHIGHVYTTTLCDVYARAMRQAGHDVFFLTGTDEHGIKVEQSAKEKGVMPQELADENAAEFQSVMGMFNLSNDDFIRTTDPNHMFQVQAFISMLLERGDVYLGTFEGWYDEGQEEYHTETSAKELDFKSPINGKPLVRASEENYYFKLSQYQDWLIGFLQENEDFIFPRFRQKQVLEFLKEPLNDLCISRPKSRLEWGIPIPFDEDYVTYVWFDALINYLTGSGYMDGDESRWPADYHVIGKDIMVPPHSIYWPIMLKASGIPLPKHLLVHGFWTTSGAKMSKSTGNTINPLDLADQFGPDSFRYFVTREMNVGQDSDFSEEQFLRRYNSELANDLGNLVSRLQNMVTRYTDGVIPKSTVNETEENELQTLWSETAAKVIELGEGFQFHQSLEETFQFIRAINRYVELRAPWKLAKSEESEDHALLETSLAMIAEGLRLASVVLSPVMPGVSGKILSLLGSQPVHVFEGNLDWDFRLNGKTVGEKIILFPKPEK